MLARAAERNRNLIKKRVCASKSINFDVRDDAKCRTELSRSTVSHHVFRVVARWPNATKCGPLSTQPNCVHPAIENENNSSPTNRQKQTRALPCHTNETRHLCYRYSIAISCACSDQQPLECPETGHSRPNRLADPIFVTICVIAFVTDAQKCMQCGVQKTPELMRS